ncbi:hypothetical protein BDW02DRAFT_598908 [Decorospora gaudefroyi]|uniref:SH3 domain-containing protein n=1 Tax=Decorospora gaudefroyi TaxID=184978 RepID=A0A6A5KCW8_9PLEO|nr:hypothetical protein BDW02DRAFT_598908 [Decorospora gaudefroyi]
MSSSESPDAVVIATALDRLELLGPDQYIIALGPDGKQFIATPNGYHTTHLPALLLRDVSTGNIKKIIWVSYGNTPGSWFFACQLRDGACDFQIGPDIPPALRSFIQLLTGSDVLTAALRVQLGDNGSFVAWSKTVWECANVPHLLRAKLCEGSSGSREADGVTQGSLRSGSLDNVQWHADGSFYIKSGERHFWNFTSKLVRSAWSDLWKEQGRDERMRRIIDELAYVAISPHSVSGETFAFIKKQTTDQQAAFIIHFEQEPVHSNLISSTEQSTPNHSHSDTTPNTHAHPEHQNANGPCSGEPPASDQRLQHSSQKKEETVPFQWATSKKTGRPHSQDSWELALKKGEQVRVIRNMGRDWFVVVDKRGGKGWVHGSWLDFGSCKVHVDAKYAYKQFKEDMEKILVAGQLCDFPNMTGYMDACNKPDCEPLKKEASLLGICIHDLLALLEGSGSYSYEWLKEGRNFWHPDRFARFCHPEHADRLKPMAEQMFKMYGVLMDVCRR